MSQNTIPRELNAIKVYRLEFWQPDGRWTGPYCAEYMTEGAFVIRDRMVPHHRNSGYHIFPDAKVFADNPGKDRYVCGATSMQLLREWFGEYFMPFLNEGGHIGIYEVPEIAIAENDGIQVVYQQRQARLLNRRGKVMPAQHLLIERIHPDKFK